MSLLFSFGFRSTKNNDRGMLVRCCLMLYTFITVCPWCSMADFVFFICGVVHTPEDCTETSFFFGLVCMELRVFFYQCLYDCSVFVGGFWLNFDLIAI